MRVTCSQIGAVQKFPALKALFLHHCIQIQIRTAYVPIHILVSQFVSLGFSTA